MRFTRAYIMNTGVSHFRPEQSFCKKNDVRLLDSSSAARPETPVLVTNHHQSSQRLLSVGQGRASILSSKCPGRLEPVQIASSDGCLANSLIFPFTDRQSWDRPVPLISCLWGGQLVFLSFFLSFSFPPLGDGK